VTTMPRAASSVVVGLPLDLVAAAAGARVTVGSSSGSES
jgi:hypothetical protein